MNMSTSPSIVVILIGFSMLTTMCQVKTSIETTEEAPAWTEEDRKFLVESLSDTRDNVLQEVNDLTDQQWNYRESPGRWSIAEIVEHLELHDELYRRELTVLTQFPEMDACWPMEHDTDDSILSYGEVTSNNSGKSPWYLEPKGRWRTKEACLETYTLMRNKIIDFVQKTDKDLRKYYSPSGRGKTQMRDLHQLMLISVAHTKRHLVQLRKVKSHAGFPKE